jgi:hypothetical protein
MQSATYRKTINNVEIHGTIKMIQLLIQIFKGTESFLGKMTIAWLVRKILTFYGNLKFNHHIPKNISPDHLLSQKSSSRSDTSPLLKIKSKWILFRLNQEKTLKLYVDFSASNFANFWVTDFAL